MSPCSMPLATKDLVAPLGFVPDKAQWLDRYSSGDLLPQPWIGAMPR